MIREKKIQTSTYSYFLVNINKVLKSHSTSGLNDLGYSNKRQISRSQHVPHSVGCVQNLSFFYFNEKNLEINLPGGEDTPPTRLVLSL